MTVDKARRLATWNKEVEQEILQYAENCRKDADQFSHKSKIFSATGTSIQFSLIITGTLGMLVSGLVEDPQRQICTSVLGALTSILSGTYSLFHFSKRSIHYHEVSTGLKSLERALKMETYKPIEARVDAEELFRFVDETREKLFKRISESDS
jgi:hypothetical protein